MYIKNEQVVTAVIILSAAFGFLVAWSSPYGNSAYAEIGIKQESSCNIYNSAGTGAGGVTGGAAATGGNMPPAVDGGVAGDAGDIDNICISRNNISGK